MKSNKKKTCKAFTHEGGRADAHMKPLVELERAVSTCLLFENTFYEDGNDIADRIEGLCKLVKPEEVSALAIKARTELKLRHVPLFLCVQLLKMKAGTLAGDTIRAVVKRPDEMGELLALYWKKKRIPLAAQLKKALADVYPTFNEYQLAKWDRDGDIKLKDVLFMCHAEPKADTPSETSSHAIVKGRYVRGRTLRHTTGQGGTWKQLIEKTLESAETWEFLLSTGHDKKATWEKLLTENKLGFIATLMNLRNMNEVGVDQSLIDNYLLAHAKNSKALPFRFISAYKHAPACAQALSDAMQLAVDGTLDGTTALVIDVSGSMSEAISSKGELKRYETAAALAVLIRGLAPSCRIFAYNTTVKEVGNFKGLALLDCIKGQVGGQTNTALALKLVQKSCPNIDRVILLTDEQSHDGMHPLWAKHGYLINVAPDKPGLETGSGWVRINGWSERIVDYIQLHEAESLSEASDD